MGFDGLILGIVGFFIEGGGCGIMVLGFGWLGGVKMGLGVHGWGITDIVCEYFIRCYLKIATGRDIFL